jgi:hypothetical protein
LSGTEAYSQCQFSINPHDACAVKRRWSTAGESPARAETPEFAVALRKQRKVEALFSELKNLIGLRRLRLRRIKFVREQFYLAAVAQNLKRLVRFLNMRAQSAMATA